MGRHLRLARAKDAVGHCEHIVRDMRPGSTWDQVTLAVNAAYPDSPVTKDRLVRSVRHLVEEGMMPAEVMVPVPSTGRRAKPRDAASAS